MAKKKILLILVNIALLTFPLSQLFAEPDTTVNTPCIRLHSIGVSTGYGRAPLDGTTHYYEFVPLLYQIGFDINPLVSKLSIRPKGIFELIVEPLTSAVISPNNNAEVGCSFFLRYSQKVHSRVAFYLEFGLGMLYTTQHTIEQGSQFNFTTQPGLGMLFFFNKSYAMSFGYRFRHVSNAGTASPNRGLDFNTAVIGLTHFFE